ncbi:MAG TPA: hypothetical protein DD706_16055 [Nitrospiraceae bacterium]|nr:hypothetical protein [Nitrospiraceae bacterium]
MLSSSLSQKGGSPYARHVHSDHVRTRRLSPHAFPTLEGKQFCTFLMSLLAIADALRSPTNRVRFFLSCAYFRATKRFFAVQSFHQHDIEYIAQRWGLSAQHILPLCNLMAMIS